MNGCAPCSQRFAFWAQVSPVSLKRRGMATTEGCHVHRVRPHQAVKLTVSPLATAVGLLMFFVRVDAEEKKEDGTSSYGNSTDVIFLNFRNLCNLIRLVLAIGCWLWYLWYFLGHQCFANFYPHLIFCFGCCLVRPQQTYRHRHLPVGGCQALLSRRIFSPSGCCSWGLIQQPWGFLGISFLQRKKNSMACKKSEISCNILAMI